MGVAMRRNFENMSPQMALLQMRIVWAALLIGQLIFMGVVIIFCLKSDSPQFEPIEFLYVTCAVICLALVMASTFIRMQIYKRNWVENAVTPNGYIAGQIVALAMIEGANLMSLLVIMLNRKLDLTFVLPIVLLGVFLMSFPNGKPMQPARPDFLDEPSDLSK
jgi:hypothetical protein